MGFHVRPRLWEIRWIIFAFVFLLLGSSTRAQIAGTNVNMVSGTQWPGGDPFLQRQNEPSIAVSSRNPFHLLAGANDYRSVDLALTTNGETGDAWLGLFKSLDGGATWRSVLLPGCPYNTPICAGAPNVKNAGYQAAADPTVRAGTNGMFYYAGLVFNRGFNPQSAIVVSRLIDLNNKENADPNDILNGDSIQYVSTSVVATGTSSSFLDKPTMAVDVPRFGASMCNLTVNQPGNGEVNQSFQAGNVYVTYTAFEEQPNTDPEEATGPQKSTLYFVRSTNCGATWSKPLAISGNIFVNQGTSIAIDPTFGTIYVAWREFQYQSGNIHQPDAIVVAASFDGGRNFTPPERISTFTPFDEGTTNTSFRTNAYPTIAVDNESRVYVAYAARNTVPSGDARIVLTSSFGGFFWANPVPIDNPPLDPVTNPSGRGHQIMPALTFAGGKLSLLYYDLRLDHTFGLFTPLLNSGEPTGLYSELPELAGELALNPPDLSAVFNQFIDDSTIAIRRHTFDLRMAEALPARTPAFGPSILVSQYSYGCCAVNQTDIEQMEFNAPNLPLFKSGTAPFMGDYVDLAPGPLILPPANEADRDDRNRDFEFDGGDWDRDRDSGNWHFNLSSSTPTIFHAAWTDNRDVQPPADGDWTHYTPPNSPSLGSTSIFQPGTTVPVCEPGFTGSRNQNIYTAPISGGLVFGAPSNAKTLGNTVFNGKTVPFQRAFVVVAQNTTETVKSFRLTIANQPTGGAASFEQFAQLTTLDLSVPPLSSASRPVFVVSTSPTASVTVNIAEITAPQGTLVPGGLTGNTTLNPDVTNPGITNPAITNPGITNPGITNFEVTTPGITNPGITNPTVTNPGITNPGITNPGITNSTFQNETVVNPGITNPGITNPGITNASIANPGITNPGITNVNPANVSITDTQWTVVNNGNTEGAYTVNLASSSPVPPANVLQLIISKLYQTPAAPTGQSCNLAVETHNVIVTNIVNPALLTPSNPGITNPGITNPGITNATVALAPGETAKIIIRVVNTDIQHEPTFNPAASVLPVVVSQSVNTQDALSSGGGGPPPIPPISVPPLIVTTTTLPDGVNGVVYSTLVGTQGGNPTAHTFSVTGGGLPPGLTLGASTGSITGVPAAAGTFNFTIQVQDVGSPGFPQNTATQQLSIRIATPLVITTAPTLAGATQGAPYSQAVATTGGVGPFSFTVLTGALPAGLTMSGGVISGTPTGTGTSVFTIQVTDSSNPPQVKTQSFTITIASAQIAAAVTFVTQPQNSIGGQVLTGSPVVVKVTDTTGVVIPNIPVTIGFNGTAPCTGATLGGTLSAATDATGQASFGNLTVNRGQFGFTLLATAGNATAVSSPFNIEGYCDTGSMAAGRHNHDVIALPNGKVLVAGGAVNPDNSGALASAELYDPKARTFSTIASMNAARVDFTMTLLQNGKVLITGGFNDAGLLSSAEIFDPAANTFTLLTAAMTSARAEHTATLLANGKVLITGGNATTTVTLASAEIFDPVANSFTATSHPMNAIRQIQHADLLPNGKVLISGGFDTAGNPLASAELYDPVADTFTLTGSMNVARGNHASTLLDTGKMLVAGGLALSETGLARTTSAEVYDPATATWTVTGGMTTPRAHYFANTLSDGTIFIPGTATLPGGNNADIYDPVAGTFRLTANFTTESTGEHEAVLQDGTVLLASGVDINTAVITNSEIFYPLALPTSMSVLSTNLANATEDTSYTQLLFQRGGVGPLTWSVASGALPPGITLSTSGILAGTPTAAGTFTFTVQVTDSATPQKTATSGTLTLTVAGVPLQFTSNTMPAGGAGRFYSQALPIIGGKQPYTVTQTGGTLPPGLSLSSNGTLAGTPSAAGSFTFTVKAVDSSTTQQTATQTFTITVDTLFITTTELPNGVVGVPYNAPISTAGGTLPLSFSLTTGALPPGLLIQQPAPTSQTGALTGTPTQAGTFEFSESVVDSSNPRQTATQNYAVTIAPAGTAAPAHINFVTQPLSSVGGQTLAGNPIVVSVTDANNAPISGTSVVLSFNGTPPCSSAILSGTLEAATVANGQATFSNLSIDRGQFGYTLLASAGSASAASAPFNVQGFCESGNLSTQRELGTQVGLGNGKVLIAGGEDNNGNALNTAELYDPATGATSPTGNLTDPNGRVLQVSVVLPNGKVLLAGGESNVSVLASAELYDPASGTFTATGSMSEARFFAEAVMLADGRVLVTGGFNINVALNTAEIYDPATGLFTPTGNMNQGRGRHQLTLLPNGKVLVTGGRDAQLNFLGLASAEIFDPSANGGVGAFTIIGNMNSVRFVHTATLLSNGTVLIAGGFNAGNESLSVTSAEIFDPSTNTFTLTGSMNISRARHTAALLPDGTVLMAGGINSVQGVTAPAPSEIYSPTTGTFGLTGAMITGRELTRATLLFNGNVLVAGGDDGVNVLASTEVYYNTVPTAPIVITTASVPNGFISQPYVQMLLERNGTGPITWSLASGALPPGIAFAANGFLTGTPTATGSFTFTVQVTDGIRTTTGTFTINVSLATLAFTSNSMPLGGVGRAYSQALPVTGGTLPYAASVTGGNLPPGLALSSNGVLSGTPSSAGSFSFTVTVTDASTPVQSATQTLTIAINSMFITTTALPDGIVGVPYNASITASGGTLPLVFSSATAAFPPGLTIQPISANQHSVALFGTPTTVGHYVFSETVTDSSNPVQGATQTYTMDVLPVGLSATPATLTFLNQPQNSIGGQILAPGFVRVQVRDANNAPVAGASVAISFNGVPPCSSAVLSGTLTAITGGNGNAVFGDLSIDRGQLGYTLLASAGTASAVSQPFTVNGFCETGNLSAPRRYTTSTLLPSGKVLVAGGDPDHVASGSNSSELFDPASGTFTVSGTMTTARAGHSATLLNNGQVLITGGRGPSGALATAELYNPTTGLFTLTGALSTATQNHTATLLTDGRVLITGGDDPSNTIFTNDAELYDPVSGTFSHTGNLTAARAFHTATLLPNGKVLIAGGRNSSGPLASVEIYDPVAGSSTIFGNMNTPRSFHTATLLPDGKVLLAGGQTSTAGLASAELFDPSSGTFAITGTMLSASVESSENPLPDGTVLITDGFVFPSSISEIYEPLSGAFAATGSQVAGRIGNGATLLADGQVLLTGGATPGPPANPILNSAEIYYSTAPLAPLAITTPTTAPPGTTVFTDPTSFGAATSVGTTTGFNGIVPAGATFAGFNPLVLNRITFSTPLSTSGVDVNVTKSTFYTPNVYPADFITASVIPATGVASANNTLTITLPAPATAFAMDLGGLGFLGASTGTITLSNGFSLPLSSLPTVGHTEFRGFVSTTPFNTITFSTVNDDFVVLDVLVASADTVLPAGIVGKPYTQMLLEQGGLGALTWTLASGSLPQGITLRSDGVLIGTPTTAGTFTFAVHLVDGSTPQKSTTSSFILTVTAPVPPLVFATQTLPTAITGATYNASLAASASGGTQPYNFAVTSGTLPAGITLATNGTFSGTPTTAGSSTFTVTVTDSSAPSQTASQSLTINVVAPLAITTSTLSGGTAGVAYNASIASSGGTAPVSFAVTSGTLPPGLTLSASGTLSGTPTTAGTFTFTITATDGSTPPAHALQTFTITVALAIAPTLVSVNPNTAFQGQQNLSVAITGQATHFTQGTTVANFGSGVQVQTLTVGSPTTATAIVNIAAAPNASINLNFFPNTAYNANTATMDATLGTTGYTIDSFETTPLIPGLTVQLSGGVTPTTWTSLPNLFDGDICPGLTSGQAWDGTDTASNQIANQATSCTEGSGVADMTTFNYAPGATSFGIGLSNFQSVNPPSPQFPITNHELFVNGVDMGVLETLAGSTWSPGLTRNAYLRIDGVNGGVITSVGFENLSNSQGIDFLMFDHLAVLPSATVATRDVTMTTNTEVATLSNGFTVNTNPIKPLVFGPQTLPTGFTGTAYTGALTASGGRTPYSFAVTSGTPPAGITLGANGTFTGTPTTVGPATFTVTVTDSSTPPQTTAQTFAITVVPPFGFLTTSLPAGTVGVAYSQNMSTTGGTIPVSFSLTAGTLPPGTTLAQSSETSELLGGSPTTAGTFTFTITATDSSIPPHTASQSYTVTIAPAVQVPATIAFVSQPQNSVGGQVLSGGPVTVQVNDATGAPVSGASVLVSFNGTPPCSGAILTGTLAQATNAAGQASFTNLSIDRGQLGYTLAADIGSLTAVSSAFNVEGFCSTATPTTNHLEATATMLTNGLVLLAGGFNAAGAAPVATAELYNPAAGTFTATGNMTVARGRHTATLLNDGTVLLTGGTIDASGTVASTAETYNPASGTFTAVSAAMSSARSAHSATLLSDGTVLVAGGLQPLSGPVGTTTYTFAGVPFTSFTNTSCPSVCRITGSFTVAQPLAANLVQDIGGSGSFTPVSFSFTDGVTTFTNLNSSPFGFNVNTDANGNITFYSFYMGNSGNVGLSVFFDGSGQLTQEGTNESTYQASFQGLSAPGGTWTVGPVLDSAEIYNPSTKTFAPVPAPMVSSRQRFTSTLLPNGKVLLAGGYGLNFSPIQTAEIYDPVARTFTATPSMAFPHAVHSATLLPNGTVAVIGGFGASGNSSASIEVFDPVAVTFTASPAALAAVRASQNATLLPDGRVLIDGGFDTNGNALSSAETFNSVTPASSLTGSMQAARTHSTATLLPNGTVLAAGGTFTGAAGNQTPSTLPAEVFYPASVVPISITTVLPTALVNVPYTEQLQQKGGIGTLTWVLTSGTLPAGLTLSSSGLLSGTPTTAGASTFTVQVTDSSTPPRTTSANFLLAVVPPLTVVPSLPTANPGVAYSQPLVIVGGATPYTSTVVSGALPTGLTLSNGVVSGTTTVSGTFTFTVKVTDSSSPPVTVTQPISLTVAPPLSIVTTTLPNGQVGTAYSASITTTGGASPVVFVVVTGALPAGLTLSPQGLLSGIPTTASASAFTIAAGDSSIQPQIAQQSYTVTIASAANSIVLTPNPVSVPATNSATMTVTLGSAAPANGLAVALSSSNTTVASVPGGVTIPQGATTATFQATAGTTAGSATITASGTGFTNGTAIVNVALRSMTLTTPGPLLGVGRSFNATVTLDGPAPAAGTTVTLASSDTNLVTVAPASVTIPQGSTTGTFTLTGVNTGVAILTASAPGFQNAVISLTTTNSLISLQSGTLVVAPGQSGSLAVSLSSLAPNGGVTINFSSGNAAVATVTSSVVVPQGQQVPAANPQVTGVGIGATVITASAAGFAPDTAPVQVTVTASFNPTSFSLPATRTGNITLNISAPAPQPNGITFNLASDNTNFATVPGTVTIPAGQLSVSIPVTGVAQGTANLSATSAGIAPATAVINVSAAPTLAVFVSQNLGQNLQVDGESIGLSATPSNNELLTLTSNSANLLLASSPAGPFSQSITLPLTVGSFSVPSFSMQGLASSGTVQITAQAAGYSNGAATVALTPSGISWFSGDFTTTTFSPDTTRSLGSYQLSPGTLIPQSNQNIRTGLNVSVTVTSSAATVGTIVTSPVTISGDTSSATVTFHPLAAGTTNLVITTPAGFSTPTGTGDTSMAATVSLPNLSVFVTTNLGQNLQVDGESIGLGAAPPTNETLTLTSNSPNLLIANSPSGPFSQSITLALSQGSFSVPGFSAQGLAGTGTAQLTASAPGYNNGTATITFTPSGISWFSGDFATTTFSPDTTRSLGSYQLSPSTLAPQSNQNIRTGLNVSVTVTSSAPTVGTIVTSPVVIAAETSSAVATFHPLASGTTNLVITTPAGFSTPTGTGDTSMTATVNAPNLSIFVSPNLGQNLQVDGQSIGLGAAPPTNETLTLTSNSPNVLLASAVAGPFSQSITLPLSQGSFSVPSFSMQGLASTGTAQLTASAAGYNNGTATVTLTPSGISWVSGDFTTTTFSPNTTRSLGSYQLSPSTLNPQSNQNIRTGFSVSVTVTSSAPTVGTIVGSPVTILADTSSGSVGFHPLTAGTTNMVITTPAGFTTPTGTGDTSMTVTVTAPNMTVSVSPNLGQNLQVDGESVGLGVAPPNNETLTLSSSSSSVLLATTPAGPFTQSISLPLSQGSFSVPSFSMQGLSNSGSVQLTAQAPGYADGTATITLTPSGISWISGDFTTTTFSPDSARSLGSYQLSPSTLAPQSNQNIRTGLGVSITVTSSTPTVGTIVTSPVVIAADTSSAVATFHPLASGTTNLVITTPAGFSTPTGAGDTSMTATVSAPNLNISVSTNLGQNLQVDGQSIGLGAAPPTNESLTLTSNSPNLLIANSPSGPFSQSITLALSQGSFSVPSFSMQGLASTGTAQLTASAPGYNNGTATITLTPSAIEWVSGDFTTTTFSPDSVRTLGAYQLNPSTLTAQANQNIRMGLNVSVTVTSSTPTVGTIVTSPVTLSADTSSVTVTFHPLASGTTNLVITTPAGFTTPNGAGSSSTTATVNAPNLNISVSANLGQNLQVDGESISLGAAPPTNETLTLTSNSPNVLIANSPSGPFSQSITLALSQGSFSVPTFSMQGLANTGTAQLTASAPGYNNGVAAISLTPSAIEWNSGTFTTTTFSPDTTLSLSAYQLNPTTLTAQASENIRTGMSVSVKITSSTTTVGTIVTSPVTITSDTSSTTTAFHPIAAGFTDLVITTPAGFTAPNGAGASSITATVNAPSLNLSVSPNVGENLQVDNESIGLGVAPPTSRTLTLSSNSAALLLATTPAGPFSQSITLPLTGGSFSVPNFSMQSLASSGTAQLTASAPGYADGTATITLTPSGILWQSASFSTTVSSSDTTLTLIVAQLSPTTLTAQSSQAIRTGMSASVTLVSSSPVIGTVVSPVTFPSNSTSATTSFHPLTSGATNLVIATPTGFTTPNPVSATSITATVN